MKKGLNILEILKNKQTGTKLYADAFGELSFEAVSTSMIFARTKVGAIFTFYNNGKYSEYGEPILVPSKEMQDWSKFAWKKGDVLVSDDEYIEVIFDKWYDNTYTSFYCKHYLDSEDKNDIKYLEESICSTWKYSLEDSESSLRYVTSIEDRLGGKLNFETLEIEKNPASFRDGDIVCISGMGYLAFSIAKSVDNSSKKLRYYVLLNDIGTLKFENWLSLEDKQIQPITEAQQIFLFDVLAKENKAWDAEKKAIVDLKPKWNPKPFDRVITRVDDNAIWTANIFSHMDSYGEYVTIGCIGGYPCCIPYNEETAKLIGTTNNWKG